MVMLKNIILILSLNEPVISHDICEIVDKKISIKCYLD